MIFESLSVTKHMMLFFALSTTLSRVEFACTYTIESVCDGGLLHVLELTNFKKNTKKNIDNIMKKAYQNRSEHDTMCKCVIDAQ